MRGSRTQHPASTIAPSPTTSTLDPALDPALVELRDLDEQVGAIALGRLLQHHIVSALRRGVARRAAPTALRRARARHAAGAARLADLGSVASCRAQGPAQAYLTWAFERSEHTAISSLCRSKR